MLAMIFSGFPPFSWAILYRLLWADYTPPPIKPQLRAIIARLSQSRKSLNANAANLRYSRSKVTNLSSGFEKTINGSCRDASHGHGFHVKSQRKIHVFREIRVPKVLITAIPREPKKRKERAIIPIHGLHPHSRPRRSTPASTRPQCSARLLAGDRPR